jgi:hypothetical protein
MSGTVGYQFANRGSIVAPIRLVGSPDASDPARIRTLVDKDSVLLGAQAEVKAGRSVFLQFGVEGLYGDRVKSESANLKLKVSF